MDVKYVAVNLEKRGKDDSIFTFVTPIYQAGPYFFLF